MKIADKIRKFTPYHTIEGNYTIWLDKNENPFDIPPPLKKKLFEKLTKVPLNRYGSLNNTALREKLATFWNTRGNFSELDEKNIVVGAGSDELLSLLIPLFQGDYVVISSPAFSMYRFFADLYEIPVVDVPLDEEFQLQNVAEFAENAKAIFICSPHNPTGVVQDWKTIKQVLDTGVPVILDEAYGGFSKHSHIHRINEYDNLIVLRTFSKAFGLAGIRVGYAVTTKEITKHLLRIQAPYTISVLSSKIAEFMLDHYEIVNKRLDYIIKERERIRKEFNEYAFPSNANFLLVNLDAHDFLLNKGIVVKNLKGRLAGMIRITIGKKEENDKLIDALQEFIREKR
ncbi:MAG: histidinol-phosphate transaminase [Candidatus Korarchaeota archaeon]|nr:histidinol-phosphate transaminase [Candidatus Korarchaeota archaeon]NIU81929.1 histidinol-phosphate transaminase [Candidatus Thorarchaeota archaeon]NIW12387.1 histidinol-phosphate transaminase [Candidatus Thorarchaeota archaeon]NIW51179.1 histidinol-phosphate transaminase [Candidatus Korarchaeota archaeon]